MGGNAACWMDHLRVQGEVSTMFTDFKHMFIDQYAPLDNKNSAWDKSQELVVWNHIRIYYLIC